MFRSSWGDVPVGSGVGETFGAGCATTFVYTAPDEWVRTGGLSGPTTAEVTHVSRPVPVRGCWSVSVVAFVPRG